MSDEVKYPNPPPHHVVRHRVDDHTVTYVNPGLFSVVSSDMVAEQLRFYYGLAAVVRVQFGYGLRITRRVNQAVSVLAEVQVSLLERILQYNRAELIKEPVQLVDGSSGDVIDVDAT